MPGAPTTALLVLVLLATAAAAQPDASPREQRSRPIVLGVEATGTPPELRISLTDSTVLLFDSLLARVEVERPERFRRVRVAGDTLTLVPAGGLEAGARVGLTVHFQDGGPPERAVLVLDAASTDRQFEVYRRPLAPGPQPRELESLREENQRLRQEVERLRSAQARPGRLAGLLADSPLKEGDVAGRRIDSTLTKRPGNPLRVHAVWAYRAGEEVALVLEVDNPDTARAWQLQGATLEGVGTGPRALAFSTKMEIGPGERSRIVMGGTVRRREARGTFTLTLREAGGGPSLTLGNITFP